jgi:putative ABC transport system permease protein
VSVSTKIYGMFEGITIALDAMRGNKVRAGLTILGVAVGVFVIVVIAAAIHGINASVARDFESAGPTTFYISRFPITFEACDGTDQTCKWLRNPPITQRDAADIARLPTVKGVYQQIQWSGALKYRDKNLSGAELDGFSANWTEIDGGDIPQGRSFTALENAEGARVVIISDNAATRLFGESEPLDKQVTINNNQFTVIGIYHSTASFLSGGDRARALMPIETLKRTLNVSTRDVWLAVKPPAGVSRDEAIDDVTAQLRANRGLRPGVDNTFAIITQEKLFEVWGKISNMFFLVMFVLSAIGLIVGGVGVVAIMMISVTERTREIGVRKALGATRGAILWQFLVEAVTMTGIGAMVGYLAGWLISTMVRQWTPIKTEVPPFAIVLAVVASIVTGVVFGMYPAFRAARLDPVDALRYE